MKRNLQELLKDTLSHNSDESIESELKRHLELYGEVVYQEVMNLLTGKNMSQNKAKRYWLKALALRNEILKKSLYRLSIRAALLEVLQNRPNEFKNLVFIETSHLDSILHSSTRDGLTGLYNQTYFKTLLRKIVQMRQRTGGNFSALILLDLDYFKHYNDSYGHLAGDEALCIIAGIIREQVREQDVAARYGGDEFAVYLPNVTKNDAFAVVTRIRHAIESTVFPGQELLSSSKLTTSSGISFLSKETSDAKSLIEEADRELYTAKRHRKAMNYDFSCERRRHLRNAIATPPDLLPATGQVTGSDVCFYSRDMSI